MKPCIQIMCKDKKYYYVLSLNIPHFQEILFK